ncbi:MAG TPA: proteasome accessory factor PafA2 family protein [Myxococcota bacterium]|nr:proteasome accessory factor PafA2 family protein [Myxococcota bacterium]
MRDRVFGIETEYAVIYHPRRGERAERPTNLALYGLFEQALRARVASLPRALSLLRAKRGRFLENGASFHYEATSEHFEHGLLELASPECRDPFTLLACERAKDALVEEIAAVANQDLRRAGIGGTVRIGKNNVDSQGHTFGSHESYWVEDPLPWRSRLALAPVWLALWIATLPVLAWFALVFAAAALTPLVLLLLPLAAWPVNAIARRVAPHRARLGARLTDVAFRLRTAPLRFARLVEKRPGDVARFLAFAERPLRPVVALHGHVYRRFHFRSIERGLTAFLVTRTAYAGAGAVVLDGGPLLRLAQRPPHLRSLSRIFTSGDDRPLYESRDLFFRPWSAFSARRRLHLLVGDANLCEWAQVLRVGATALVLEAIEADPGGAWPRLADPLGALHALNRDAELGAELELTGGTRRTAIAIQRAYLERVRDAFAHAPEPPAAWKGRVLAMWDETLALLERDPDALADRVDWIAKRALVRRELRAPGDARALESAGAALLRDAPGVDDETRRLRSVAYRVLRTDLRYHELGPGGGYRRLRARGRVRTLADPDAVERARRDPPSDTRAFPRGRAIRAAAERGQGGGANWHRVRIGALDWRWFLDPLAREGRALTRVRDG